ncbi:hypothetical protein NF212_05210 [Parasalinivibrio latis]|uniref:hypothetical protein n=1 Tax=Parasalinivibrio latis TaxID=2952610 RepID=UPI0030E2BF3F
MTRVFAVLLTLLLVSGCGSSRPFEIENLVKSDMDMITDIHVERIRTLTQALIIKLYKRNPSELAKVPGMTMEMRLEQLMSVQRPSAGFEELNFHDGVDALPIAFDDQYHGDRVFALMAGVTGMLSNAYNNQTEFYLLDELDQQKLYNSARNLESVSWLLNNRKKGDGTLFLLSNGIAVNGVPNYSYERVLSQMIVIQDMMAAMISDSTNRTINKVVHSVASMTFLPI